MSQCVATKEMTCWQIRQGCIISQRPTHHSDPMNQLGFFVLNTWVQAKLIKLAELAKTVELTAIRSVAPALRRR